MRLDDLPPMYTNLGTVRPYGTFELGFGGLANGLHVLNVAIVKGKADWKTSYSAVCFSVK